MITIIIIIITIHIVTVHGISIIIMRYLSL